MSENYSNSDPKKNNQKGKKTLLFLFLFFFVLAILATGFFLFWKIHQVSQKINIENSGAENIFQNFGSVISSVIGSKKTKLVGEDDGRVNILFLGVAGKNYPGRNLTDTVMIMSLDTKNKKVGLLSLPRDLYANIAETEYYTKINQIYQHGLREGLGVYPMRKTTEAITGLVIHYFVVVDFDGFQKIIDDIGGINIMVERDIYDPRYPGPNYSYETFEMKKGLQTMNGSTALKFARQRHNDPEGDFGRAKRQQAIIQAVKNKVFSTQIYLNPVKINRLLETLADHVITNFSFKEIERLIALSHELDTQNVNNVVVDAWKKDSLLKVSHIFTDKGAAFILVPRVGNWSEVQELAANIFQMHVIDKRKLDIEKEEARVAIVNQSGNSNLAGKIKQVLTEKLNIKQVQILYYQLKPAREYTTVIDLSDSQKIFTLDEIMKKVPARLEKSEQELFEKKAQGYDLVLLLGKDLVEKHSFVEVSAEEYNQALDKQEEFEIIKR